MSLKKFLSKYEVLAKELVRCGSCSNILLHCGDKYEIVKIGIVGTKKDEEGLLCETCKRNNRNIELVTKVSDDGNNIFQVPISQLNNNINTTTLEQQQQQSVNTNNNNTNDLHRGKNGDD
jgi:hypothetical protein